MSKDIKILALIAVAVIAVAVVGSYLYRSSVQSKPAPDQARNSALVRDDSPALGPADAKVTIVEFLDPECESCAAFNPVVKNMLKTYDGRVRLVVRYMPLHPNSVPAANFMEAAGEQGKYWQAQELLFRKQPDWGERHGAPPNAPKPNIDALFEGYAKELGLDLDKTMSAVRQNRFAAKLDRDRRDGQSLGVRRTPTIFVNGRELARLDENQLKALIDQELK